MADDILPAADSDSPVTSLGGRRPRFFYLVSLPVWFAVLIRSFDSEGDTSRLPISVALLFVYLGLFLTADRLSRRFAWYQDVYFGLQLAVVFGLMVSQPNLDFYPVLLIPLSAQIALVASAARRRIWFGATLLVMIAGLLIFQSFPRSLAFVLLYGAGFALIASYAMAIEQQERAEAQARALVEELQEANRQLTDNAGTLETLAVVQERNRLARELHDSVSQSLYGLVLSAEAARRQLTSGDDEASAAELESMVETARAALAEMRLLIYELRPSNIEEHGLQRALETRLATVERRAGLQTTLDYRVSTDLPVRTEIELERVAIEALNNAVRHAHATAVAVSVSQEGDRLVLAVQDDGSGFDASTVAEGFGLRGMRERAERLEGTLSVEPTPDAGTLVLMEVPL